MGLPALIQQSLTKKEQARRWATHGPEAVRSA